jgi:hypothetical protein
LSSTRFSSSWAAKDAAKVTCSWPSPEICIWPYVVKGPVFLPWGVPLQHLNFSYDVDLCFMYYITLSIFFNWKCVEPWKFFTKFETVPFLNCIITLWSTSDRRKQ